MIPMDTSGRLQSLRKTQTIHKNSWRICRGVSRQAIAQWEIGQAKPEFDNLIKLAEIDHITTDFLLLGKEIKKSKPMLSPIRSKPLCLL